MQVEKQERRVQQSRPRQSPHTPDPFVVRPFADGEDDGSDSESLSTSVRSTSRDSRPALPRHMAPARYMSDTALLAQSSKGDGGLAESHASGPVPGAPDTPTPAHPDAEEEGRGRPPPVVAWNAPDESIVTSPSSVSVASPRRILVQALAEEQQPDVIPAPTPFRPTGMPRTRAVPRPAYDLRQAWGGSDDDDQQHQDQQQDQQQDQHVPTRVERQRLLVTASKTRGEYRLMQSDSRDDDDDDDDDEDEVRRGVAGVTVGAPMPSIWEEDEDEGDETETEDMTAHVEVDYAQDAAHAYAHPQYIITDDSTPLQIAAAHGQTERVAELLAQGVDVNEEDGHGRTAVMYSVHCNHIDTTRLLISQGADLDHRAQDGATALHRAAYCGTRAMVMLLLESGSDHRIPDEEGRLPLPG
ncbi:hypothetical protein PTSG_08027 [Salpingoeca rosetta]|uniref:Uncharacterized protein n=1 Tax=Salpingoeca rosetta (strain ATCC 50818 / BSB-021) TaxID=946362 RepID=F2UHS8_SALR5|nr:uncharacterized protein PTSG_08027 [Salpingoeca rosetta]EGD76677.1 hypothetical protein PTSG_08027 [Salpingoeca rosetta]|eukprot:XP_004991049.1 hypothetical protein PTSG_08027 [Salpingoeca rosetta]